MVTAPNDEIPAGKPQEMTTESRPPDPGIESPPQGGNPTEAAAILQSGAEDPMDAVDPRGILKDVTRERTKDLIEMKSNGAKLRSDVEELSKLCHSLREAMRTDLTSSDTLEFKLRVAESRLKRKEQTYFAHQGRMDEIREKISSAMLKLETLDATRSHLRLANVIQQTSDAVFNSLGDSSELFLLYIRYEVREHRGDNAEIWRSITSQIERKYIEIVHSCIHAHRLPADFVRDLERAIRRGRSYSG